MAIAWQSKAISRYSLVWQNDRHRLWGIAIKISYVFLHQLDLVLTILAGHLGLSELNPLMRDLLSTPLQLGVIKFIIPFLIAWFVPSKLLIPAIVFLFFVIGWNIKELLLLLF